MNSDEVIIRKFLEEHGHSAAGVLEKLNVEKIAAFFDHTPTDWLAHIVPELNSHLTQQVLEKVDDLKVIEMFETLPVPYAEQLIRKMNKERADGILNQLSKERSSQIRSLLKYPKESVGSYMDPAVFTIQERMTIEDAVTQIKKFKSDIDPNIYVLKSDGKLIGTVRISDLFSKDPHTEITKIMNKNFPTIPPETPFQSLLNHDDWMKLYTLPVVDKNGVFQGVIRLETIRKVTLKPDKKIDKQTLTTINALGELFQIGLGALLRSATDFKMKDTKE